MRVNRSAMGSVVYAIAIASLPARLGDAGDQAPERILTETDAADAEAAKYAARAPTDIAAGIGAHRKLGFALCFLDQSLFCQTSPPLWSRGASPEASLSWQYSII